MCTTAVSDILGDNSQWLIIIAGIEYVHFHIMGYGNLKNLANLQAALIYKLVIAERMQ